MCLAFFPTCWGHNRKVRELLCLQCPHSSRNADKHMSVTLIFSKVRSDYVRALPKTPKLSQDQNRIADDVAGRNWRTLRRLWILLQGHGKPLKEKGSKIEKELLNFTIISSKISSWPNKEDMEDLTTLWSFNFTQTDTFLFSVQAMTMRIKAVTDENVWHWASCHPSKLHPFSCYCLFFKKNKLRLRMVK